MIVKVEKLVKKFKNVEVLKGIDLNLESGKIYGFVGRNGSGKTMLMKSICGFIPVTKGEIEVMGKRVGEKEQFAQNTGFIIETPGFIPNYSAYKNIEFLASINKNANDKMMIILQIKHCKTFNNISITLFMLCSSYKYFFFFF